MGIQPKDKPVVITADNYNKRRIFKYSFVNPKILGLLTVVLLMVVGVGAGVYLTQKPPQTQTQATLQVTSISLRPPKVEIISGSSFSIDVFGNANENQITSAQLGIIYDPQFLELVSITPMQFLPKVLTPPTIASGSASVSLGTDGNSGISGAGIIASLSFKAKEVTESTEVSFDKAQTKINILGNTSSPLGDLEGAVIIIKPKKPVPTTSAQINTPPPASASAASASASASASPAPSQNPPNYDFNSDFEVNSIDLSVIYSAWGKPQTDLQKRADLNGDGAVNGLDYALFLPHLNK